jgi:hypothetical protein
MTSYRPIKPRTISGANFGEHLNELRNKEMTRLPQDRATLIKVLARLEKRKLRRAMRSPAKRRRRMKCLSFSTQKSATRARGSSLKLNYA